MIKRYTFLKHPFYYVLDNSKNIVGGLEKCVGVFYNPQTKEVEVLKHENSTSHLKVEDELFVKELRKTKNIPNWLQKGSVPFELSVGEIGQISFDDEEKSSVLELRFLNTSDNNYDILYFYFKHNIGNFKLTKANEAMAVPVKEVVQNLLYNQIQLILSSNANDFEIYQKISSTYNDSGLQGEINRLKQEKIEADRNSYNYLLNRLTEKEDVEFVLSTEAVHKISELGISLTAVEQLLYSSLEVIINKFNPSNVYEISVNDINFKLLNTQSQVSVKQENLNKTRQFLDKYENAAKIVTSKNLPITGLNIGTHCIPKVSPAAISDILKKHQKKMHILFQQYPENWPILRNKFKPIVKLYERGIYKNVGLFGA